MKPVISTFKYLGILSIALAACGDDSPANDSSPDTADTANPPDTGSTTDVGADSVSDTVSDTASDSTDSSGQPDTTGGTGVNTDSAAVATIDVDGHRRTTIDSSSSDHWTHFSFATGALAVVPPAGTDTFDLGLQRYLVKLGQGMRAATLDGVAFADLALAPSGGVWLSDGETAAISDWWDYDGATHTLSAKADRLYVVDVGGRFFKVRFRDYYDEGGSPSLVTFDWAEVASPDETEADDE